MAMKITRNGLAILLLLAALGGLLWHVHRISGGRIPVRYQPGGIMGTSCELVVVVPRRRIAEAAQALKETDGRLRDVEARMSVHLAASQLSRLNAAPAGETIPLHPELLKVLEMAGRLESQTDGAFDATCRPVLRLWRKAQQAGREPTAEAIAAARALLGMRHLRTDAEGATKLRDGVQIDLGGLAKGYAVDQAVDVLQAVPETTGGMVNIGGDLRCFGRNPAGRPWGVGVRHPFRQGTCGLLEITDAAVATSGDYERGFRIAGQWYSHILDPRTGRPVANTPSVTVVSLPVDGRPASAAEADGWATALSVLGRAGLEKIHRRADLEAMIVTGTPQAHQVHMTGGFRRLLAPTGQIDLD
jgi:thiamine biosynthesis lipoprotein